MMYTLNEISYIYKYETVWDFTRHMKIYIKSYIQQMMIA